jgi:hypothetical protein
VLSISPNALSQKVSSDLLKRIDSLKSFNESFNTRLLVLQDSIKSLRADQMKESTPCNFPSSDHSHTLIYVLIGLLFLAVVVLFLKK